MCCLQFSFLMPDWLFLETEFITIFGWFMRKINNSIIIIIVIVDTCSILPVTHTFSWWSSFGSAPCVLALDPLFWKNAEDSCCSSECVSDGKSDSKFASKCHCSKYSWIQHKMQIEMSVDFLNTMFIYHIKINYCCSFKNTIRIF